MNEEAVPGKQSALMCGPHVTREHPPLRKEFYTCQNKPSPVKLGKDRHGKTCLIRSNWDYSNIVLVVITKGIFSA